MRLHSLSYVRMNSKRQKTQQQPKRRGSGLGSAADLVVDGKGRATAETAARRQRVGHAARENVNVRNLIGHWKSPFVKKLKRSGSEGHLAFHKTTPHPPLPPQDG